MGKLVLFLPDGSTRQIALEKERIVIGRRADNDVCLPFPAVSGEHAAVVTILADSFLEDMGSTNGTLVNGAPVQKHFLRDRDQIDIGRQKLIYLDDEAVDLRSTGLVTERAELRTFGEQVPRVQRAARNPLVRAGSEMPTRTASASPLSPAPDERAKSANEAMSSMLDTLDEEIELPRAPSGARVEVTPAARPVSPAATDDRDGPVTAPPPDIRRSTDRALEHMARIRSGDSIPGRGFATEGSSARRDAPRAAAARGPRPGQPDADANAHRGRAVDTIVDSLRGNESSARDPSTPPVSEATTADNEPRSRAARVTVLSGASAGRSMLIETDEVVVGRVGVQVAAINRAGGACRLSLREGETAPILNGERVPKGGMELKTGDIFEVAGARLEFIAAG